MQFLKQLLIRLSCSTNQPRAFSGGRAIARAHAGTRPNVRSGAIDRAPGNTIFPLKRAMSHSGVHIGKFCIFIFHISYHLRRVALRQKPFFKGPSDKNLITIYN